jgi:hypothetical protein
MARNGFSKNNKGRRGFSRFAAVLLCLTLFCSCASELDFSNLLSPPKLTAEQTEIYQALVDAKGRDFTLKYPRSGDYRSAFITKDLDGDNGEEALVMYATTKGDDAGSTLWLTFFDTSDGKWYAKTDYALPAVDIERVMFEDLRYNAGSLESPPESDPKSSKEIPIICYTAAGGGSAAIALRMTGDGITKLLQRPYNYIEAGDFFGTSRRSLMIITCDVTVLSAQAMFFADPSADPDYSEQNQTEDRLYTIGAIPIQNSAAEILNVTTGEFQPGTPGIFITFKRFDTQSYATNVITYNDGKLANPIMQYGLFGQTLQRVNASTELAFPLDVNADGLLDIPATSDIPGYRSYDAAARMRMTVWRSYQNRSLSDIKSSYYTQKGGYMFVLPGRWMQTVTARVTLDGAGVEFLEQTEDVADANVLLLAIRAVKLGDTLSDTWSHYDDNPERSLSYYISTPNNDSPLALTAEELRDAFFFLPAG